MGVQPAVGQRVANSNLSPIDGMAPPQSGRGYSSGTKKERLTNASTPTGTTGRGILVGRGGRRKHPSRARPAARRDAGNRERPRARSLPWWQILHLSHATCQLLYTVPRIPPGMRKLPATAAEDLLEIVMRRYERANTLLTSNGPVEDWGKLLGDSAVVTAMLDRLLRHGHVLKCGPRSWRTKMDLPEQEAKR